MRTGSIIKSFNAKDGRKVVLRTLRWEDLDDCIEFINSLIDEGADITAYQKVTRESEAEWLAQQLLEVEKGNRFVLLAEVDGKVVGNGSFTRKTGLSEHVGVLGIAIKDGFRDVGIGTEIINNLVSHAEDFGIKMLTLTVFSTNARARHVYEKVGFRETGIIPKELYRNGKFIDHIIMVKDIVNFS